MLQAVVESQLLVHRREHEFRPAYVILLQPALSLQNLLPLPAKVTVQVCVPLLLQCDRETRKLVKGVVGTVYHQGCPFMYRFSTHCGDHLSFVQSKSRGCYLKCFWTSQLVLRQCAYSEGPFSFDSGWFLPGPVLVHRPIALCKWCMVSLFCV